MKLKVLIIDDMHESIIPMFKERGIEVTYLPKITRSEIMNLIPEYQGIVVRSKTEIDEALINQAAKLKFIARAGAGLEKMDVSLLEKRNIAWVNAPEGNRDSLGEHAVGVLLSLLHRLHTADRQIREKVWDREGNRGMELKGKTVGIFGYGFMGSAFAEKLTGFGCKVIAYDKYKSGFGNSKVEECSLEDLFRETQILSIHIPLTEETKDLFDIPFLKKFEKLKLLLNTARGKVISNATLVDLLKEGSLYGVGLDVLENEKIHEMSLEEQEDFKYLTQSPQVLLTPHVGGWSHESYQRINEVIIQKLESLNLIHKAGGNQKHLSLS